MTTKHSKHAAPARADTFENALLTLGTILEDSASERTFGLLGPNMPRRGMSMNSAYTKLSDNEIAMITANCRSAMVAVSRSGSAVRTVESAEEATGVPISMSASLQSTTRCLWQFVAAVRDGRRAAHYSAVRSRLRSACIFR